ncbi:PREDICTED: flexible cuticle protein 12-like [Nicrophorus vespilloides]|uniref:Flexible cuticle protein 12-like n=1 Tax=Nicrophorus vespilloides TaxID=110193 RepID=A0ABM1NG32_NICVS|nr:PREDICTED: flexible cuticle protein 12-like [Nicrophorus vespilloides]
MKVNILLLILAIAEGIPNPQVTSKIIKYEYNTMYLGAGYKYAFESDDGIKKEETGEIVNEGRDDEFIKVMGSYSYIKDDGKTYIVVYTADENGFHPSFPKSSITIGHKTPTGPPFAAPPNLLISLIGNGIR